MAPFPPISRAQMEQQFSANFSALTSSPCACYPRCYRTVKGRIVMTSSVMGLISTPGRGAYMASKYALEAWSDALRMELRHSGIKVQPDRTRSPFRTPSPTTSTRRKSDKPVENPGIAARFTLGPEAVVDKSTPCFLLARSRRCAIW